MSIIRHSYVISKGHTGQTTIRTKLENDVSELHQKEIRCDLHISLRQQTLREFDFLSPALNIFLKG